MSKKHCLCGRTLALRVLMAALCVAAVSEVGARVFRRWRSAGHAARALEGLGGASAYEADVSINNGSGRLTVFSFNRPIGAVFRDLRRTFDPATLSYAGGDMGFATFDSDGRQVRLVVIHLPEHAQTLVFKLAMTASSALETRRPPDRHRLTELPEYPGSVPLFFARDSRGGLGMATSTVRAHPELVQNYYRNQLTPSGWTRLAPHEQENPSPRSAASLALYEKGRHVCIVYVEPSATNPGEARLTLLHKQPGAP